LARVYATTTDQAFWSTVGEQLRAAALAPDPAAAGVAGVDAPDAPLFGVAGILIEHGQAGTRVSNVHPTDDAVQALLRKHGFKTRAGKNFYWLNSQWLYATRSIRVERLTRDLENLGRTFATAEHEARHPQVSAEGLPTLPPAPPFTRAAEVKKLEASLRVHYHQAWSTPAGRSLLSSWSTETREDSRALKAAHTSLVQEQSTGTPEQVVVRFTTFAHASRALLMNLQRERKNAPAFLDSLGEVVKVAEALAAGLQATANDPAAWQRLYRSLTRSTDSPENAATPEPDPEQLAIAVPQTPSGRRPPLEANPATTEVPRPRLEAALLAELLADPAQIAAVAELFDSAVTIAHPQVRALLETAIDLNSQHHPVTWQALCSRSGLQPDDLAAAQALLAAAQTMGGIDDRDALHYAQQLLEADTRDLATTYTTAAITTDSPSASNPATRPHSSPRDQQVSYLPPDSGPGGISGPGVGL
jgi:hypothetical protein